jgi:hypothetical protein
VDFAELVFKRIDESWIKAQDYIEWANELLEDGCEAPSIWQLAACSSDVPVDPDEVERLFQSCISELGLELPNDWCTALCAYSSSICENMLQGRLLPWECVTEMLAIADDHNEPYIHWIWIDLVDDLHRTTVKTTSVHFYSTLNLSDPEACIRIVAEQFVSLCSISLPERFPWIWRCEVCGAISKENTFTEVNSDTCTSCGGISTMKNLRFFEHRDVFLKNRHSGSSFVAPC